MTRLRHSVKQFAFGIVLGLTAFVLANHLASLLTLLLLPALFYVYCPRENQALMERIDYWLKK